MRPLLSLFFLFALSLAGEEYRLGHGLKLADALTVGGYVSTEYKEAKGVSTFDVDDVAFLAYGDPVPRFSYLFEYESAGYYEYDFREEKGESGDHFHIERLYLDYAHGDALKFRAGKFITPVGIWNLTPINVLRETTSNPYLSHYLFPKFVSGVQFFGYLPGSDATYHLFAQDNEDLDEGYINIATEQYVGGTLNGQPFRGVDAGISLGRFNAETEGYKRNYLLLNGKWRMAGLRFQAEGIYAREEGHGEELLITSAYLQGLKPFSGGRHALVFRGETYDDDRNQMDGSLFLLGYNYRPLFPVSLKAEYQFHDESDRNLALFSFSVLF